MAVYGKIGHDSRRAATAGHPNRAWKVFRGFTLFRRRQQTQQDYGFMALPRSWRRRAAAIRQEIRPNAENANVEGSGAAAADTLTSSISTVTPGPP